MSFYIGHEAPKLWRRICVETTTEINLLAENWKYILGGLIFQIHSFYLAPYMAIHVLHASYMASWCIMPCRSVVDYYMMYHQVVHEAIRPRGMFAWASHIYIHGLGARGVHYLHRPGPTLQDAGYFLLPELGSDNAYISETVFTAIFLSFVLWTFHPFIFKTKKIYTVLIWCRVLAFLVACQFLRMLTFYSTQLPGPNYHCREGSKLATLPRPDSVLEVLLLNFPRGLLYGCGDLIFSSHMIFSLVFVWTYQKYGTRRFIKQCAWIAVIAQSFLIVASRKHYTVDVVVAWYTVNLVVFFVDKKLPELPDRTSAASLLPVSKDSKTKEENHKLLNGNADPEDWRPRTQINGMIMEDGNAVHVEAATNGV